ncbi:hypothetical protein CBS12448_9223 [Aspergillus niger]|nr:hypothetical protein CBS12448_9223 [Aspergillus niger]KAI2940385.1 hypothetical protein CBS147322_9782 [Aspergillus niger]
MVFTQTSRLKVSDINDSAAITFIGTDVERIVQSQKIIYEIWAMILKVGSVLAIKPISNRLVRQNIILGSLFDPKWYEVATWACGLKDELSNMPGGDLYRAGANGLSLSGGQKQRIALCRAIYSRKRLMVLDDVFSGLDSKYTSMIATRLFGPNGYCRRYGVTVLLATHTDEIVILEGGRIVQNGSFEKVMQLHKPASVHRSLASTDEIAGHMASATEEDNELNNDTVKALVSDSPSPLRREGTWSVYKYYYQSAGFIPFATCLAFIVVEAVSGDFKTLWIQWWVEANEESPNKDVGMYLGVYAVLFVIQLVGTAGGLWLLIINVINNTALNLHTDLLSATLSAPLRFFQDTEIGALTNRFSQDMELIDMMLPLVASMFFTGFASCVVKLVILCIVSKYLAVAVPALLVSLVILQRYYLRTSRQQWLTLVMGLIVAALAVIIAATTTSLADQYNGAAVGVALSLILTFNSTLSSTLRSWTSLETIIGAVSRVQQFVQDTPREANNDLMGSVVPRALGLSQFTIEFDNITAAYG